MALKTSKPDVYKQAIAENLRAKTQRITERTKINGKSPEEMELIIERTRAARVGRQQGEIMAARARGELILKATVRDQADFIASALRQKILNFPRKFAPRLAAELGADARATVAALEVIAHELCRELASFDRRVADPNWLREVEEAEDEVTRP